MSRRPHWAGELVVIVLLLVVYDQVSALASTRAASAVAHGRDILTLEHVGLERAGNLWLAGISWLQAPAAYYYDLAHLGVTMAVLVGGWAYRVPVYRRARRALLAINVVGLAVFLCYPVAPPRLLPGGRFDDVVAGSGTWGAWEAGGGVAAHANELASMPSLHVAWAVWVALTVATMTPRRRWRALAWAHVVMTCVVVVVTGNHYLLDLVAGALTCGVAWAVSPILARRLRHSAITGPLHRARRRTAQDSEPAEPELASID